MFFRQEKILKAIWRDLDFNVGTMDSYTRVSCGMPTFESTQIGIMESKTWGRKTNSKAGTKKKSHFCTPEAINKWTKKSVRNDGWEEFNELNNYLDLEVIRLGQWYVGISMRVIWRRKAISCVLDNWVNCVTFINISNIGSTIFFTEGMFILLCSKYF